MAEGTADPALRALTREQTPPFEARPGTRTLSSGLAGRSHDVVQPVHALQMALGLVLKLPEGPARHEAGDVAEASLSALHSMLNNLLEMARMEAGMLHPALTPLPLAPLLHKVLGSFQRLSRAKDVPVLFHEPGTPLLAMADPDHLPRLLGHLLDNALRFTETGSVRVQAWRQADRALVEIVDSGPGIGRDEIDRVCEPFARGSAGRARRHAGIGLGLSNARGLARQMGGELTLRSTPGQGTAVRLSLPAA